MGLVRVYPGGQGLGNVIVYRIGDTGGPVAGRVESEFDTIFNWSKDSLRRIHSSFPSSLPGNTGAGPDTLHTYTLDTPNRLNTDGDYLRVRYAGLYAGDNDNKQINVLFDSQTVSTLAELQAPVSWVYDITYGRVDSTHIRYASNISWGRLRVPNGGALADEGLFTAEQGLITVANLNNNAVTLLIQGGDAGSETGDVQLSSAIIELAQQ